MGAPLLLCRGLWLGARDRSSQIRKSALAGRTNFWNSRKGMLEAQALYHPWQSKMAEAGEITCLLSRSVFAFPIRIWHFSLLRHSSPTLLAGELRWPKADICADGQDCRLARQPTPLTAVIYFRCRAAFFRGADPPPGGRLSTGRGVEQWQLARLITWRSQVQVLSPQFARDVFVSRGAI